MAQDYYDPLQVLDHLYDLLDDNKADLGIKYIARIDENLLPEYPAILLNIGPINRELHATQMFRVEFYIDLWIFHAELSVGKAIRSVDDIKLATSVRKLLHENYTLGGHVVFSHVTNEQPGQSTRIVGRKTSQVVTTRLAWMAENRVPYNKA